MVTIIRKTVRTWLAAILALLIAAFFLAPVFGITSLLELDKLGTVAIWFKSFLFLASAALLGLTALHQKNTGDRSYWRWGLFGALMLYLSINTATDITNKLVKKFIDWAWWFDASLVDLVLFVILAAALLVLLRPVLAGMPINFRWRFLLSGLTFGLGAIMVDDLDDLLFGGGSMWMVALEELLENTGIILFLDATLLYLSATTGTIRLNFSEDQHKDSQAG